MKHCDSKRALAPSEGDNGRVTEAPTVTDRRVNRTRRALTNALIALTLEKGYEAVTVRDLAERADIGYATFFRHFSDKDALLADVLEGTLQDLLELIQPVMDDPERTATLVFDHVGQHRDLVRVLLRTRNASPLMPRIFAFSAKAMLERFTPKPEGPIPPEIAAHHMIASFIELIEWWLEHDAPYPPERMGAIVSALIIRPTREIAFLER
jgi:AcrR family transcriptional regulator